MRTAYGVFLILLSILLIVYVLLSSAGLMLRFSHGLPGSPYEWGRAAGQAFIIVLFYLLGVRAFRAGRRRLSTISRSTDE